MEGAQAMMRSVKLLGDSAHQNACSSKYLNGKLIDLFLETFSIIYFEYLGVN